METAAATVGRTALRTCYRLGWRLGPRLPDPTSPRLRAPLAALARSTVARGGRYVDQLRENLSVVTGRPAGPELLRAAYASYFRTLAEVFGLAGWSLTQIQSRVSTTGEDGLRRAYAERGAVVALPHSGNWDLAGAWACASGMPVTTVAEDFLGPGSDFEQFRRRLGLRVLGHTQPGVIGDLIGDVSSGRVVCLLADRDLAGSGLPVRWGAGRTRMPPGPAMVARRSGAALIPAVCVYTEHGMRIDIGPEIPPRPGRAGLQQMTQQVADYFAAGVAAAPQDWHLLQPFFEPADSSAPPGPR